jgi:hypothetical protein
MGVTVHNTVKGSIDANTTFEAGPKTYHWRARVYADQDFHVRAGLAGVKETGQIAFAQVADAGSIDTVTVNDGVNPQVVFTFNDGTGGSVNRGVTATDSAQNLKTAILAAALNVDVTGAGATITIINNNYTGGSISKVDADNDYTVTQFSGGVAGPVATSSSHPKASKTEIEMEVAAGDVVCVRGTGASGTAWISEVA